MDLSPAELTEAAKLARHHLRGFEAFAQLAKAFDGAASAIEARDKALEEHATLQAKLQDAREAVAREVERQAGISAEVEAKVANARAQAEAIVADAKEEAKAVKAAAAQAADATVVKARKRVEDMEQTESEAGERVAALRAEATQLEARVKATKAEIAKLLGSAA